MSQDTDSRFAVHFNWPRVARRAVARWLLTLWPVTGIGAFGADAPRSFFTAGVQPILDRSCVGCHGPEKQKGGLRLDSFATALQGGEDGPVLAAGAPEKSELYRRITLPADDDDVMPASGKPRLASRDVALIEAWIRAGASADAPLPELARLLESPAEAPPLAPDYRPFRSQLAELERVLAVRLVPVSRKPTDGLILRTATAPERVDDVVMARLAPIAPLIVDAELSRTRVTDGGLAAIASFINLRRLDLAHTEVTTAGLARLLPLSKLQTLNLVETRVDASARATLKALPELRAVYDFGARPGVR